RTEGNPAQQPKPEHAKRYGDPDLAAQAEKNGKADRQQPARGLEHACAKLRIDFRNDVERPKDERQHEQAEDEGRHGYLSCASSLRAPSERRADRSASALMPPAA